MSGGAPWDYIAKLVCIGDSGTGKSSLTIRLCEGRFTPHHDVTIGVEFGSRIVPVGPPASNELNISIPSSAQSGSKDLFLTAPKPSDANQVRDSTSSPPNPASKPNASLKPAAPPAEKSKKQPKQKLMKLSLWDTAGQETYKSITRSYFRGASGALLVYDITRRSTFLSATSWLNDLRQIAEENIVVVLVGNKSDLADEGSDQRTVSQEEAQEWCRQNGILGFCETSAKSGEGVERAFREVAERVWWNVEAGLYDLGDRRSGVKGYGNQRGGAEGTPGGGREVVLGLGDVSKGGGRCC